MDVTRHKSMFRILDPHLVIISWIKIDSTQCLFIFYICFLTADKKGMQVVLSGSVKKSKLISENTLDLYCFTVLSG